MMSLLPPNKSPEPICFQSVPLHKFRPVYEVFQGKTVWQGDVEVFDLTGHSKAKRAYAWSHLDGANDERTRFVAVLEIPPVVSAETAVRVQIVKDVKEGK